MNDLITIVIPCHNNRHYYLNRVLSYYHNYSFNIIVIDSSENCFKDRNKYNAKYIHTPDVSYTNKLNIVINSINTKYTLLCPNDDFIIPSAIKYGISFLENNSDYYSCQGNIVWFYNSLFPKYYPLLTNYYMLDINSNNAFERIKSIPSGIFFHYSIHRTENLLDVFNTFKSLPDDLLICIQQFLDLICISNGKHRVLPVLFSAKEISIHSSTYTLPNWGHVFNNKTSYENFVPFLYFLINHIAQKSSVDINIVKHYIHKIFDIRNEAFIENQKQLSSASKAKRPYFFKGLLIRIYEKFNICISLIKIKIKRRSYLNNIMNLNGFPSNNNQSKVEWEIIKKYIKSHYFRVLLKH